ncbi:acetyltransferase (GNAT) family protein [Aminobacter aminovorans]|uniref:Putative acetyltransferase n=1 Tax=Aminobacter aminovorans TaxID=83263 RepID=A0A380WGI4_AMIAI|nr:GNAT family N-acetyltransferase [Aminobacter aminovorans]TCS26818.1 acetyltransferase (GNAT) family protein [Aminobacter aminovorans]SUU88123.1 putative acetyltransferase [Aminobacter aminovorans]
MTVGIRAARADERETLGALKLRSSLAWGDHVEALQALPEAREVPAAHVRHVVVAEIAGQIVGFVTVLPGDVTAQAELEDLFVAPEAWRMGIGSLLLAEAERRAAALGARSLEVVASERARPFYQASGFRFAGIVATLLAPAVRLRKDLP